MARDLDVDKATKAISRGVTRWAASTFGFRLASSNPARAFAASWRVLPGWRTMGGASRLSGAVPVMEFGYRAFSPFRPTLAKIVGRFTDA